MSIYLTEQEINERREAQSNLCPIDGTVLRPVGDGLICYCALSHCWQHERSGEVKYTLLSGHSQTQRA